MGDSAGYAAVATGWSDALTFTGGGGSQSVLGADFTVSLIGLLMAENYFLPDGTQGPCAPDPRNVSVYCAPTYVKHAAIDFGANGAVLDSIGVHDGVQIGTESGTHYPVQQVPEPSTMYLMATGLAMGIARYRRTDKRTTKRI
jgi:hypothetical protein